MAHVLRRTKDSVKGGNATVVKCMSGAVRVDLLTLAAGSPSERERSKPMKLQDAGRREFLQRVAGWGLACATGSYLAPSLAMGQNNPGPPPPEPADTTWIATIVPAGEPGDPLIAA